MISISKKYKTKIVISFHENSRPSPRLSSESKLTANSVYSALEPDITDSSSLGVGTSVHFHASDVVIRIETRDVPSLRASINSYLRLVKTSILVLENSS